MSGDAIERLRAALGPESVNADAAGIPRVTPVSQSSLRLACQVERPPEEVGHKVRVAMRLWIQCLEPVCEASPIRGCDGVLAGEGWITDQRIKAWVLATKNLGKLDLPMKRPHWLLGGSQLRSNFS